MEITKSKFHSKTVAVCALIVLTAILGISWFQPRNNFTVTFSFLAQTRSSELDFEIYNSYTKEAPIKGSPWRYLAEPFRETTLSVTDGTADDAAAAERFEWKIDHKTYIGSSITHTFRRVGRHGVLLTDTTTGKTFSAEVMCKYVRREIRTLTDEDRDATLDSLETLYRLSTVHGQEIYGSEYRGMDFFLKQHIDGAGLTDCDHWHDDAGIMTHHVGFTLEVEQSMQLVNPVVSMPYWDYTIDDYLYDSDLERSIVWDKDWFGVMSPRNSLKVIDEGRWAYLPLPYAGDYGNVNPYGLLRTAWNVNSVPYITRSKYLNSQPFSQGVGCSELYTAFQLDSISDLNEQLNGETHGPVHIRIGGEWGAGGEEMANDEYFSTNLVLISKILWRAGYLRIPESCDGTEKCVTSCPKDLYENQGKTAYDVMYDLGILSNYLESMVDIEYDEDNDAYHLKDKWDSKEEGEFFEAMLNAMCDAGKVGEMYTSAAPADPSFWILHPAAERFLNLRRIVADVFPLDETWGYTHQDHIASDSGWVCDWSDVKEYYDMPSCAKSFDCSGHHAEDILEFSFFGTLEGMVFNNEEFYEFMHPYSEKLPYMYDNYNYDHCTGQGYDFLDRN